MDSKDKNTYIERYTKRFNEFGHDTKTLGWGGGKKKQDFRFSILSSIGNLNGKTILDVGCGFGDLYSYLKKQGWKGNYIGVDIVPVLIKEANKIYPEGKFILMDILEDDTSSIKPDYIFASGIFNAKVESCGGNENYIKAMITKMFSMARIGVCVDFLSTYVDFQHEIAYHTSPEWFLNLAQSITRRVCLRHDYMPYEFCAYMYKNNDMNHEYYYMSEK